MEKHPLVRTIYLYLFTIVGLALLVIGCVRFIDMGLKIFVFKQADEPQRLQEQYSCQFYGPISIEKLQSARADSSLTPDEQATLKTFLDNYQKCLNEGSGINYLTAQRQRNASTNLALIIVGLPLYWYHWRIISRETKKNKEET